MERPATAADAAALLRAAGAEGRSAAIRGGGTKLAWGPEREPDTWVSTSALARIREHNAGDLTAVLEAGVPLAEAQGAFAAAGQMLALDPPLGAGNAATVGGVLATADAGPLRHRYGAARDLVLGVTIALADGSVARAGGKVIKNVAGYDLGKLFAGSRGALGLVAEVVVRLHPLPARTLTVVARSEDAGALGSAAVELAARTFELEAFDVRWERGGGALLLRVGGVATEARAARIAEAARTASLDAEVLAEDGPWWAEQRARQRSAEGAVVRVSSLPTELPSIVRLADEVGGSIVGRAALGLLWLSLPATAEALAKVREALGARPSVLLDASPALRQGWSDDADRARAALEERIRARFDPQGVLAA